MSAKWIADLRLREEELSLKRIDAQRSRWNNPLTIAILAAAVAGVANAAVGWQTSYLQRNLERDRAERVSELEEQKSKAALILEQRRSEAERILETIKVGDADKAANNLRFLVDTGLLTEETSKKVHVYLDARKPGQGVTLPEPTSASPFGGDFQIWGSKRRGRTLSDVQSRLTDLGFYQGELEPFFGPRTEKAVKDFQAQHHIVADGIVGVQTDSILFGSRSEQNPPP